MTVCSARTGAPQALLADEGWLTDARTAAAGALAARAALTPLSTSSSTTPSGSRGTVKKMKTRMKLKVAVLGAGVQARMQLDAIRAALLAADDADDPTSSAGSLSDREPEYAWDWEEVRVWARRSEAAEALASELLSSSRSASGRGSCSGSSSTLPSSSAAASCAGSYGVVSIAASPREAVLGANLVITATPSREPLISSPDWLSPGATVVVGVSTVGSRNRRTFPFFPSTTFFILRTWPNVYFILLATMLYNCTSTRIHTGILYKEYIKCTPLPK